MGGMTGTVLASMPRAATGTIDTHQWADGRTVTYRARVRFEGRRYWVEFGTNHEGWNEDRARVELERVTQQIARGTWQPPARTARVAQVDPAAETFQTYSSRWWAGKRLTLDEKGAEDMRWRLGHLNARYHDTPMVDFEHARTVDDFRVHMLGERERVQAGGQLPGRRKPLGPRSINMILGALAMILDAAVRDKLITTNHARGPGTRVKQERKRGNFLEPDMVIDLLDVAGEWEREPHLHEYMRYGRRALLALLCLGGPRIEEATSFTRGQLDLHAGVIRGGSKTAAGRDRQIELSWFLLDELRTHVAARDLKPGDLLFGTRTGRQMNPSNIRTRLIAECIQRANDRRSAEGRLLLPERVTPHSLRRTFASLCFFAGRDPRFVMSQIGHEDARLTLGIYAQAMERRRVDQQLVWTLMRYQDEPEEMPGHGRGHHVDVPAGRVGQRGRA